MVLAELVGVGHRITIHADGVAAGWSRPPTSSPTAATSARSTRDGWLDAAPRRRSADVRGVGDRPGSRRCRSGGVARAGIRYAGTNERNHTVDVFSYLGPMAVKLLTDAAVSAYAARVLLVCDNPFLPFLRDGLERAGAAVDAGRFDAGDLDDDLDAVVVALTPRDDPVVDESDIAAIAERAPGAVLAQFWGDVPRTWCALHGVPWCRMTSPAAATWACSPRPWGRSRSFASRREVSRSARCSSATRPPGRTRIGATSMSAETRRSCRPRGNGSDVIQCPRGIGPVVRRVCSGPSRRRRDHRAGIRARRAGRQRRHGSRLVGDRDGAGARRGRRLVVQQDPRRRVAEPVPVRERALRPTAPGRGRATVNWAIINGEPTAAISIHHLVPGLDAGGILYQETVPITPTPPSRPSTRELNELQRQNIAPAAAAAIAGAPGEEQDERQATYLCTRVPDEARSTGRPRRWPSTDWCALQSPFPSAFTWRGLDRLHIEEVTPVAGERAYEGRIPGRVVLVDRAGRHRRRAHRRRSAANSSAPGGGRRACPRRRRCRRCR